MPAPFTVKLCGYRENGNPNTSDNSDAQSKELGRELFDVLGVPEGQVVSPNAGGALEEAISKHLAVLRPDLSVARSRPVAAFEQYEHLSVFPTFRRLHSSAAERLEKILAISTGLPDNQQRAALHRELDQAHAESQAQDQLVIELLSHMPEEALLRVDVTVADASCREGSDEGLPRLHVALSSKWSLRTDRAQDCVSQGSKLVAQRRGRMPHFAVVTIEPRPAMLKILGDGSGSIDCVYHLDLPALTQVLERVASRHPHPESWSPLRTFRRLVQQRRLRDYDELVSELKLVPSRVSCLPSE